MTPQFLSQSRRAFRSNGEPLQGNATQSEAKRASQASRLFADKFLVQVCDVLRVVIITRTNLRKIAR